MDPVSTRRTTPNDAPGDLLTAGNGDNEDADIGSATGHLCLRSVLTLTNGEMLGR